MENNAVFSERDELVKLLSDYPEVLTNQHIQKFTYWSINTINQYASDGKLPKPLPMLGRFKRYSKEAFIDFWIARCKSKADDKKLNKVGRPTIAEKLKKQPYVIYG